MKLTRNQLLIVIIGRYSSFIPESEVMDKYANYSGKSVECDEINRSLQLLEEFKLIESQEHEYGKKYKLTKKGREAYKSLVTNIKL